MYNYIKILMLIYIFLFSTDCFAQKKASTQIPISISLIKAAKINKGDGDIYFNNIKSNPITVTKIKTPQNSLLLEVSNLENRRVVLEINDVPLYSSEKNYHESKIFFKPIVNSTLFNPKINIKDAGNKTVPNEFESQLVIIGGELTISQNVPKGNYTGELILTLVY